MSVSFGFVFLICNLRFGLCGKLLAPSLNQPQLADQYLHTAFGLTPLALECLSKSLVSTLGLLKDILGFFLCEVSLPLEPSFEDFLSCLETNPKWIFEHQYFNSIPLKFPKPQFLHTIRILKFRAI